MKKLVVIASLVLALCMSACAGANNEEAAKNDNSEVKQETEQKESEMVTEKEEVSDNTVESDVSRYPEYEKPVELGSDIDKGIVEIEGHLYQFPIPTYQLLEDGFEITDLEKDKIPSGNSYVYGSLMYNGTVITDSIAFLSPLENGAVSVGDSYVALLGITAEKGSSIKLPGELTFPINKDMLDVLNDEVPYEIKIFGEACYRFPIDEFETGFIDFDLDAGSVEEIVYHYTNDAIPYGGVIGEKFEMAEAEGAAANAYVAPVELGTDTTTLNFELEGKLYQFPMPVSELLNNGWTISDIDKSVFSTLEPGDRTPYTVELKKGDMVCGVKLANMTSEPIALEESTVCYMQIDVDSNVTSYQLAGGVSIGTSEDLVKGFDLSQYYMNINETSEYMVYSWVFENGKGDTVDNAVEIWCSKESGTVECVKFEGYW